MANNKYIKVTLNGESKPRIVLASLTNFFLSQGAKIEKPTDEEVWAAEPTERPVTAPAPAVNVDARVAKLEAELKAVRDNAAKTVAELEKVSKDKDATIASLTERLNASETTISECEKVIEALRKELAEKKPAKKEAAE